MSMIRGSLIPPMGGGNTPPIPKDKFVEYDKNGNIDLTEKGDVILGENKELLGTDYDDTQHILASIKTYEVNEQPFVQNELANDTNHTNINSKDRPTIETPTEKKEVAYLSDITKENVGLGNVDNTADANKPVSTAVRGAIDAEVLAREGADIALNTKIESYIGKTERITSYAFSFQTFTYDDPTEYQAQQEELTTCALSYFGFTEISDIPNAVGVHNLNGGHLFIFNQEQEDPPIPASWVDDGLDTVAQATNNTLGVVKGSVEELEIGVNANGIQSVNGLTTDETEESGAFTATEYSFTSFIHAVWKKINRLFYKKLDKKTTSGDYVYTHNGTTQNEKPYTIAPTASTLAERTNTGTLRGATAVQDTDLVNLGQFNSGLAEKADKNDIRFRDGTNNSYSYPQGIYHENLQLFLNIDGKPSITLLSKIEHYDNSQTEYKKGIMGRIYTNRGSSVSFNISGITDVVLTKAYNETIIQKQNIGGELFKAVVVKRNSDNTYWLGLYSNYSQFLATFTGLVRGPLDLTTDYATNYTILTSV